ncbi:conserved membrane hypothetical protein [uncultured delta proteobacterium]|uniref:proton-translocating NAD(P)(+) transhydrogenase n=1 Tax=uncultured delta proteobacterium TaxID=34034 RepID=A0A212JAF6_9DELT|nr:conserved membrane hypothetical protein [uncultured delta proteobacterium]
MSTLAYNMTAAALSVSILYGLSLMSKVRTSVRGNLISAFAMAAAILVTMYKDGAFGSPALWVAIAAGVAFGLFLANKVRMLQMPQLVAFLHGIGGGAAAIVGVLVLVDTGAETAFARASAGLALVTGMITIAGSFVAAGKLHQILPQKPVRLNGHSALINLLVALAVLSVLICTFAPDFLFLPNVALMFASGAAFGIVFTIRVGGADMPITISLLNSFGGVSAAIAGLAIADPLLVAIGGIIGSSGFLLTRVMCRAMNRKLISILLGESSLQGKKIAADAAKQPTEARKQPEAAARAVSPGDGAPDAAAVLASAKNVIIVPGYGMALAQAQHKVKQLAEALEANGARVVYAVHPVAGRMPGHMNVLLAEADVDYEQLLEMDTANPMFADTDLAVIIGANDVVNPAANTAEGTPIYGMPVLNVAEAKNVIICNYDTKPGYAGVDNPLYAKAGVIMMTGDAAVTVGSLVAMAQKGTAGSGQDDTGSGKDAVGSGSLGTTLRSAKNVVIVPGYGMALAQAQHKVKQLADALEANGAKVVYAVHPVAGRMPGHMNVLLAEADVDYEKLLEMETVNPMFADADLAVVVGANDVVNPAANTAVDTPIYGMPVLNVAAAKNVIICNYDTKPGYAGVENPLYTQAGVTMLLGDAADSVASLVAALAGAGDTGESAHAAENPDAAVASVLHAAKKVVIVPGYGMALAQAQHKVKQLADALEANGAEVVYAVHPVAGRMPGHMNVLLAEADVDYEKLLEMETVNPMFANADLAVVVGANDVVNPAANTAVDTPIYGMPVLNVAEAKNVIICNYDTKPGYAGVENPLYTQAGVTMLLGDASESVERLIRNAG